MSKSAGRLMLMLSVVQTVVFCRITCYGKTPKEWAIVYQSGPGSGSSLWKSLNNMPLDS